MIPSIPSIGAEDAGVVGGGVAPFDPTTVSGLRLYLSADTPALGAVSTWTDGADGNDATQGTAANQPTATAAQFGSLPGVAFDGGDFVSSAQSAAIKPFSVAAVVSVTDFAGHRTVIGANENNGIQLRFEQTTGKVQLIKQGVALIGTSSGAVAAATAVLVVATYDGSGNYTFRIDRAAAGSGTSDQTFVASTVDVGRNPSGGGTEWFLGSFGAVLMFDVVLAGDDLTYIEDGLQAKWGTP